MRSRDPLLVAGAVLVLATALVGGIEAGSWIGRPFAGFLVLGNRVVASAGLSHWPGTQGGDIYQYEIVAIDGVPIGSARAFRDAVGARPVGAPIRYRLRRDDREIERTITTVPFSRLDFAMLFGSYLACGLAFCGTGLGIRTLRARDPAASGTALALWIIGMYALTATDLYGPYRLFRVHALFESFLFAAIVHIALVFPNPSRVVQRFPRAIAGVYTAAGLFAAVMQAGLYDPPAYVATHRLAMTAFGGSAVALIVSQLWAFLRPESFQARQRVKVLALGTAAALGPPAGVTLAAALNGGRAPENLMGWSGVLLPLAIGYAVLRHDLLGVDALLRRSFNYALLTAIVALSYAGALAGFDALFRENAPAARGTMVVLLGVASVAVLLPLRDRLQSTVDRLFFRSAYDFRRLVETTSARLASVADLYVIAEEIRRVVSGALYPATIGLLVQRHPDEPLETLGDVPPACLSPELLGLAEQRSTPVELDDAGLAVPFRAEGRLVALLVLGPRLSGRYYGGDDRRLLQTLANQGAVAIENAFALEKLRELNRDLERKVEERTAELADALQELRQAQAQLVNREKMASLGQLVAGIAHEINNPINFVQGNLHFLRQYAEGLVLALERIEAAAGPELAGRLQAIRGEHDLDYVLPDLRSTLDACEEGVRRTVTIIQDLRTFSRVDHAECSRVDLREALDSTLTLVHGRLRGVEIEREYGEIPLVECIAGQVNQVFLNLLANAADAVGETGTITLRTRALREDRVRVEIEDDGCGMEPGTLEHIFEPFFTTKEVGRGTGLGLAISYGIVARHQGSIRVRSRLGEGTWFAVDLPVEFHPAPEAEPGMAKPDC